MHALDLVGKIGILSAVGFKLGEPSLVKAPAAPTDAVSEVLAHAVWDEKFGILRPAIAPLGETYLLFAERLAVGGAGVVLVRRAIADMALDDNQRWRVIGAAENLDRLRQPLSIVGVAYAVHVPAIGEETRRNVIAESQIRVPFDGHAVAVVEPAKITEHQVTGKRGRFARYALHHVAVAAYRHRRHSRTS